MNAGLPTSTIPLPYLRLYRASGADAGAFLHGQLAADIASLTGGQSCFSAYCSERGQVIGLLLLLRRADDWVLAGEARLVDGMIARLQRFVLRSRVAFEPLPLRLAGLPDAPEPPGRSPPAPVSGDVLKPRGTALRYALTGPQPAGRGGAGWRWHELSHGVLWLDPETSERFVPQMLGLERIGAVSFSKGCYPGQEIIARARYLGRVKRRPAWVECAPDRAPDPGVECRLFSAGEAAAAVVVGVARGEDKATLIVAVAGLEDEAVIDGIDLGAGWVPARRCSRTD